MQKFVASKLSKILDTIFTVKLDIITSFRPRIGDDVIGELV